MFKDAKSKILNVMAAHPKLVTFAIGLGITMVIGTAIGMLDQHQALAINANSGGRQPAKQQAKLHADHADQITYRQEWLMRFVIDNALDKPFIFYYSNLNAQLQYRKIERNHLYDILVI